MCSTGRGRGGAMCVVWWWKVLESRGRGGDAPQGSRRPRGGCHRGLGHMHCDSAGPWQASASRRLRKGCPGAMSSTRTTQIWRGASIGRAVRVGKNIHFPVRRLLVACRKRRKVLRKCSPNVTTEALAESTPLPQRGESTSLPLARKQRRWGGEEGHTAKQKRIQKAFSTALDDDGSRRDTHMLVPASLVCLVLGPSQAKFLETP